MTSITYKSCHVGGLVVVILVMIVILDTIIYTVILQAYEALHRLEHTSDPKKVIC